MVFLDDFLFAQTSLAASMRQAGMMLPQTSVLACTQPYKSSSHWAHGSTCFASSSP